MRDQDGNKLNLPKLSREEAYEKSLAAIAEVESRIAEKKEQLEAQLDEKTERWIYLNDLAERIAEQNAN